MENLCNKHKTSFINLFTYCHEHAREDAEDIFQDAMLLICHNISIGKLNGNESYLSYYLFKSGGLISQKRKWEKRKRMKLLKQYASKNDFRSVAKPPQHPDLEKALAQLDASSRKLLQLYYYKGYCMEAIAREMDYKSTAVAKTQKYRSIKKLAALIEAYI